MIFKHVLFLFHLTLFSFQIISQDYKLVPIVDERTELHSIIFRLAGAEEFINNEIKTYTTNIDQYFRKFKEEKVVLFAKKIRNERSVSYDAVMSMAIHLELSNGIFKLKENIDKQSLDKRWGDSAMEFISLLNQFYKKTNFHNFFTDNKTIYSIAEKRYTEVLNTVDLNWFEKYYGTKPKGTFNLIISLSNGDMSYGPKIINKNGLEDIYAILGTYNTDSLGLPKCSKDFAETVIHEFNHSFCNNLIDKFYPEMEKNAKNFYVLVEEKMKSQAYNSSKIMLYEILVRASVIRYFQKHVADKMGINNMISIELTGGFIWIEQLIDALTKYENSRIKYPALESFMPEIIELQNSLNPKEILKNYNVKFPQIILFSIINNKQDVDPDIKELVITFDRPMYSNAYGINFGKCGEKCFPKITSVKWNPEKNNELIIALVLESDKNYSMKFPASLIYDVNGFIMKETYTLDFKTKK